MCFVRALDESACICARNENKTMHDALIMLAGCLALHGKYLLAPCVDIILVFVRERIRRLRDGRRGLQSVSQCEKTKTKHGNNYDLRAHKRVLHYSQRDCALNCAHCSGLLILLVCTVHSNSER